MKSFIKLLSPLVIALFSSCIDFSPQEPVEVVTPQSVTTRSGSEYPGFIVRMNNDQSVWYNTITSKDDTVMLRVNEPIKETLKKLIAAYKEESLKNRTKEIYLLQGDNMGKYAEFKTVLSAFKENDVYRFHMITSSEIQVKESNEEDGSLNLYVPREEDELNSQYDSIETKLTIILLKNNGIYAYKGNNLSDGKPYTYKTIRRVIVSESKKYGEKFVIALKPTKAASYKNSVDILDEMTNNNILKYTMLSLTKKEKEFLHLYE